VVRYRPKSITPVSPAATPYGNKSPTSWREQKSVVSVVSCRCPNSITTTCCQLLVDLFATIKLAASTGKLRGNVCSGFWALRWRSMVVNHRQPFIDLSDELYDTGLPGLRSAPAIKVVKNSLMLLSSALTSASQFVFFHRRTGQFFYGGGADSARKTAMLTCKITLPDSPTFISKNPGFRALYLARRSEFRLFSFHKYWRNIVINFWLLASALKS